MGKPGKNCWLKRGKKKQTCRAIKHSQLSGTSTPAEKIKEVAKLEGLDKQTNNESKYQPSIFDGETFDSTLDIGKTNASEGAAMSAESYDAKMAHDKSLSASARLHYLENDEAAYKYKHPILKHFAKI